MDDANCNGCIYAIPTITDDEDILVKCRRFPPVIYFDGEDVCQTFPDAWQRCGEFKKEEVRVVLDPSFKGY